MSADAWIAMAIARWQPIAQLARNERYRPIRIEEYLAACDLRLSANGPIIQSAPLTNSFMATTSGFAPTTTLQIAQGHESIRFGTTGDVNNVPFYVRTKLIDGGATLVISYQFLFGFNGAYSIFGGILHAGAHQADLEHVNVHVSNNGATLVGVFYSMHAGGKFVAAADVTLSSAGRPLVYLAKGSHASYPKPGYWFRVYGFANDTTSDDGERWDPTNTVVLHDVGDPAFVPAIDGIAAFHGDLGKGRVASFRMKPYWNDAQKERTEQVPLYTGRIFNVQTDIVIIMIVSVVLAIVIAQLLRNEYQYQ